jgi:hypothetical protein
MPSRALAFWSRMARAAPVSIWGSLMQSTADKYVPVFVGEVGSEEEPVGAD